MKNKMCQMVVHGRCVRVWSLVWVTCTAVCFGPQVARPSLEISFFCV